MSKRDGGFLRKNLGFLLGACARYDRKAFGLFAMYTVGCALLPFVSVFLPKVMVAGLETGGALRPLLSWAAGFAVCGIVLAAMQSYGQNMFLLSAINVRMRVSEEMYAQLMTMDFQDTENPDVLRRVELSSEAFWGNQVGFEGVLHILFDNTGVVLSLLVLSTMLSILHPLIVVLILTGAAVSFWLSSKARAFEDARQGDMAELNRKWEYLSRTAQDFSYGKDVRLYRMQAWVLGKYSGLMRVRDRLMAALKRAHVPRVLVEGLFTLLREGVVYGYLIYLFLQGRLMLSDFAMYFAAVASFSSPLNTLLGEVARLPVELRKVDQARRFLQPERKDEGALPAPQGEKLGIELENVSFAYPGGREVLHDVSLSIRPGEKLAVVGLNGAGKTTLIKLLTRLYEPTKGSIAVGGVEAAKVNKVEYFKLFSALFQEVRVFAVTVAENVAMQPAGLLDRARVERCLRLAGLWDKIEALPKGMDTMLLKNVDLYGTELSGGQNQRLALARALYKNAPLVVLDEPTAALDPLAEADLYERFAQLVDGRTAVFISHRLSSTRFCDRIILMEDGRIAEMGTHDELMALDGRYAQLFRVQAQYYQEEAQAV